MKQRSLKRRRRTDTLKTYGSAKRRKKRILRDPLSPLPGQLTFEECKEALREMQRPK